MKRSAMNLVKAASAAILLFFATGFAAFGADAIAPQPPGPGVATEATRTSGPQMRFAESFFDFGKVAGGEVVKHAFYFTNTGDRLLEIRDVKSTCGCTAVGQWSHRVEPGQAGVLPIELHTAGLAGAVVKPITVTYNTTNQPPAMLQVTGTVWWSIEVLPRSAALSTVAGASSNASTVVRIINHEEEPLTLSELVSGNPKIAAELKTVRPGNEYELVVRLVPPLGSGNIFGNVTMKTSQRKTPVLTVPVWAVAQAPVIATPSLLTLPAGPLTNALQQSVSIRSTWEEPLVLSEPTLNAEGVEVRLNELQTGRFFTFTLVFSRGFAIRPGENVELKVRSNHPQYPVIRVPITQHQPRPNPVAALPGTPGTAPATAATGNP